MPTPASVNLLYDEGQSETQAEIATWAISQSPNRRSSAGLCAAIFVTFLMFILGVLLGAFLHAIAFPDGDSPLDFLSSDLSNETIAYIPYEKEEELNTSKVATRSQEKCNVFPWHDIRLPRHLQPQSYNLTIHPNIEINKLTGSVAIDIKVINSTKLIILHADNLNMLTFYISTNGRKIESDFFACSETSQWALVMEETVEAGDEVDLRIEFEGEVLPDLQGLYISTHTDAEGKKSRSAVTQFEPSYARKMFPCFDEPNFKATFEVSVVRGPSQIVRSNMNLKISREHVDGLYIDVFHRTVKMSTYLLAVAVLSNYDYVKRTTSMSEKPMEVRLYAPRDIIKGQSEFGLDTAIRALKYFETYFNISYPLDKIDLLALDDFSEGAMENWGLVTFRDSALLHAESTASGLAKEQIALVICHEMAHQWFGNLVTMDWWNDLWLNEGFANYMEYKCVDHLFPHWNIMTRFYAENVAYSQDPDGLRSSHAISSGMRNNTNIMGLFDAISYHKAAAIIYMMQGLAGEKNFQKALIEYLNKYAYDNAKGAQLWKIVEKNVHLPNGVSIQNLANAFISQVGYPVIYVTLETDNEIVVHNQTRFFFEEGRKDEESEWPIPIHYRTNSQSDPKLLWIKPGQGRVSWTIAEPVKWVIANTGGLGYFKVLYDRRIYKEITKQLREDHTVISAIDRSMILVDAFDFAKTSSVDISTYLNLLIYSSDEDDRMTWTLINKQLKMIEVWIEDTSFISIFKDFQRSLIIRAYDRVGWTTNINRTPAQKGLQVELLQMACRLRYRDCTKQALIKYNEWIRNKTRPSPELMGVVLDEGVRQGSQTAWEKALEGYLEAKNPTERYQLIGALAATTDSALISRLLRLTLDGSTIRANVLPRVLSALSQNEIARAQTWHFFRVHYHNFTKILGDGSTLLISSIRSMVERMSTEQDLKELKAFLTDKKLQSNQPKLDQIFEQIELNIQWRRLNEESIKEWLEKWDDRRRSTYRIRRHSNRHL